VQGESREVGQVLVFKNGKQEPELLYKTENCPLQAGDRVRMSTGGGGGYGDPKNARWSWSARCDPRLGLARSARDDYGVFDATASAPV
jgi:N-methylhydantoinase B/oxoprolinase/acetone carboxylase alpha subunit